MESVLALILFAFVGAGAIYACTRRLPREEAAWLKRILFIALALRLGAATLFALWPESRYFHEDADGYEYVGMAIARHWHGSGPPVPLLNALTHNYGFYYLSGALFYVFGPIRPIVSYFNCIVGTITVFLVYRTARQLFHIIVARRAALLTAVIPSMILWSSVALKDPVMTCLILWTLSSCLELRRNFSTRTMILTLLPVVLMTPIRFYMLYILGFAIAISLFAERGTQALSGVGKQIVFVGGLLLMLAVFGLSGQAAEGTEFLSLQRASTFRVGMATTANSGFAAETDASTPGSAMLFMPLGVVTLLLSPFPWQMVTLRAALTAPEMLAWWWLFPSLIRGLRFVVRRKLRETMPLLVFAGTLTLAYSLVHGNIGSAFRQRAQIFVVLFMFASLGSYMKACRANGLDEQLLLRADDKGPA